MQTRIADISNLKRCLMRHFLFNRQVVLPGIGELPVRDLAVAGRNRGAGYGRSRIHRTVGADAELEWRVESHAFGKAHLFTLEELPRPYANCRFPVAEHIV